MGLLDDFGLDPGTYEEAEAPSFEVPDDHYEYEVGDYFRKEGTANYPDRQWIIVEYIVGDSGKKFSEWFTLPVDADAPTQKEMDTLGRHKKRMVELGIPVEKVYSATRDDVVGLTGEFTLITKNGYQNIRNMVPNTDGQNDFAEKAEAPEPKKRAPRKTTAKVATPVVEESAEENEAEEEETAEEAAPAPRRKAASSDGRKANPFA